MPDIRPDILIDARRRLEHAAHGTKGQVVAQLAREWGCSEHTVRRQLSQVGYESGRRARADAGASQIISEAELQRMAEALFVSRRKTGKLLADIDAAREMLLHSGLISREAFEASSSTWRRQLSRAGLSVRHLKGERLATELDSRHPNHVHLVDASVAILFYVSRGQVRFKRFKGQEVKNKLPGFMKHVQTRQLLIRWVVVDHYSGSIYVDYREAAGENSADLIDVLHGAWSTKEDPGKWPFCGVPEILYADQGSAQKSSYVESLCQALNIKVILHQSSDVRADAQGSRATGAVETVMNLWERKFEGQWSWQPPTGGINEIRAQAADFCVRLNSDPRYKLRRAGMTRSQLWMDITEEQLRMPPADLKVFRNLCYAAPIQRTLDVYGRVTIDKRIYKVAGCDSWLLGQRVTVVRNPFDDNLVKVLHPQSGESLEAIYVPRRRNGRTMSATFIGGDKPGERPQGVPGAHQPLPPSARLRMRVAEEIKAGTGLAAPGYYQTHLGEHSDLVNVDFIPRKGRPALATSPLRQLDDLDVMDRAVARLARPLNPEESQWISERMGGERLSEEEATQLLEALAARLGLARKVLSMEATR